MTHIKEEYVGAGLTGEGRVDIVRGMAIIIGEYVTKGGGRNRVRRQRRAARHARRYPGAIVQGVRAKPVVDLAGTWTPAIARVALTRLADSGMSQKAFAAQYGFPVGRIGTWRKRLQEVDTQA